MKMLITGSAGFIGSHLARRCPEGGDEVTGPDNLSPSSTVALKEARLHRLRVFPNFLEVPSDRIGRFVEWDREFYGVPALAGGRAP